MVIASVMLALLVQARMPDSVRVTGEPNPYTLFNGRQLVIVHLTATTGVDIVPRAVRRGDTLGSYEPLPVPLSTRHQATLDSAGAHYERREYAIAAALLAPVYAAERDNPFVANEYARTLFRIDDRRTESFDVYRRLLEQLDRRHGTNDRQVAVDPWFSEAYWKIGNLYLDRQDWDRAAFEITRFLSVRGDVGATDLSQVYTYLAEAYVHLGRKDLARWAAEQALRGNPRNADAIGYLRQLGTAIRDWPANHVFACRQVTDSIPCRGGYVFYHTPTGLTCMAPREETGTPLSPCLRIGWVYVGQTRPSVEDVLGEPWKDNPIDRADGTHTVAYLVFADRELGSYFIVGYERLGTDEIAHSVQFTGDSTPLPLDFSGLKLGDPATRVLAQLGTPETRGEFNDKDMGLKGEWWDWGSNAISFEIIGGRIYSIRLWRPDNIPAARIQRDFMRLR